MLRNLAETRQVSQLEFEYWVHIEHFPNHQEVPMTWFSEAMGILNHWRIGMSREEQIATRPAHLDQMSSLLPIRRLRTITTT